MKVKFRSGKSCDVKNDIMNMFGLDKRAIILTGATGLLGKRCTRALAEAGAYVAAIGTRHEALEKLVQSVKGSRVVGIKADISVPDAVDQMIRQTLSEFGKIDGLVNNAALNPKYDTVGEKSNCYDFESFPLETWKRYLDVNLTGMFLCTQAAIPHMLKNKGGSIVNVSSIYGMRGPDQRLYRTDDEQNIKNYKPVAYSVTKSAIYGFTKYLAAYYGEEGIRVNTLTLGGVLDKHDEEFVSRYSWRTPLGRMAKKDEYSGALIFLLSDASGYMTGANVVLDGGWTAW